MDNQQKPYAKTILAVDIAVKAAIAGGIVYFLHKAGREIGRQMRRVEYAIGANGRLIATHFQDGHIVKVRYATPDEVWKFSKQAFDEVIDEIGIGK